MILFPRRDNKRVILFPAPPARENLVADTIVFEIGDTRFAIKWSAEIEQLTPAPAAVVEFSKRRPWKSDSNQ